MNEIFRDEIIIQIINQIWNNIDSVKLNKAWLLILNCISCFSPSAKFYKSLFKYLKFLKMFFFCNLVPFLKIYFRRKSIK
jgi:hypothetical protein